MRRRPPRALCVHARAHPAALHCAPRERARARRYVRGRYSPITNPFSHYKSTFPLQVHFIKGGVVKKILAAKRPILTIQIQFPITSPLSHYKSTFSLQVHFPATNPLSHYQSTL